MDRTGRFLLTSVLVLLCMAPAVRVSTARSESTSPPTMPQTIVPLAAFSAIELRNGGLVTFRHGPAPRVTLLDGSLDHTRITIADGGRLVVDRCPGRCPRGYELEVEIIIRDIAGIWVAEGGTIQSRGNFPRQAEIGVSVINGGTIDIRSMAVDTVTASVAEGGRIFTIPQTAMLASVVNGGAITYWGDGDVKSSVEGGGVITKGTEARANRPLSELSDAFTPVPPIPPVPPVPPLRKHGGGMRLELPHDKTDAPEF